MPEVSQLAKSGRATNLLNQPNIKDRYRRTPLLVAIEGGNLDLVQLLLENGADPKRETKAPDSCNGIMLAFRSGHVAIAEYLLDHDYFELENSDNIFNYTLLHQAAYGHVECTKMLLAKGAKVNASSAFQVTPLHSAVSAGNPQVVAELLAHGADANATDKFGRTPLYLACNSFNLPIVKLLVEDGKCNVNITDTNNNSAFDIADKKNLREVCRYLLQHGAIPRAIKENASGLGILRFFRPYIASGVGHPDLLPTARTKAGLCSIGTKLFLNGGVGLKTVQNRPDEALFNYPNLLTDLFVLDLKDRKLEPMVSSADLQNMLAWCQDTSKTFDPETSESSLSSSSADIVPDPESNVPILVTPPTPPRTPAAPTPLVMSREFRSDRVKVSKDGLVVQAMPQGYQSGMKKLRLPTKVNAQTAMASYQSEHFVACVRATAPFSRDKTALAYWEMHIHEATEKIMTIGFTQDEFPLNRFHPGWCLDSYAYHNDDGSAFHVKAHIPDHGFQWGPRFTTGDIVGAGINFQTNEVFFTKNGKFLGVAYRGVTGHDFYATVSFGTVGAKAKVNLGRKPFKFGFNVPTLSWTKLGHTTYSPLAFVPHPEGNGKFLQISYGDAASRQGLISQRGNHWHSPKVCIVDTNVSPSSNASVSEQFVHAPFVRKLSNEEKKREMREKSEKNVLDATSVASPIVSHAPASAMQSPHLLVLHHPPHNHTHHGTGGNTHGAAHGPHSPRSGTPTGHHSSSHAHGSHGSHTSITRGSSPAGQRPLPILSSRSKSTSASTLAGSSAFTQGTVVNSPDGPRKRRPSKPYKRINRYADSSDSETSSISSVQSSAALDDSVDDSVEASYDSMAPESVPFNANYALRYNDSTASFDSGATSEDDEYEKSGSSGDEADEEDDRPEPGASRSSRRPNRGSAANTRRVGRPIGGAESGRFREHFNRNAPVNNSLPSEFYMPETDYQVHYTPTAIFLFAPADEEEVQLVRLNITHQTPATTAQSSQTASQTASTTTLAHTSSASMPNLPTEGVFSVSAAFSSSNASTASTVVLPPSSGNPIASSTTNTVSPRRLNMSGGHFTNPSTGSVVSTAVGTSEGSEQAPVTYSYSWTDILAEHPSVKRELMRMSEPRSALIQGHLYFFTQYTMLKLDIVTMKHEVKTLLSVGPRGSNFTSTVICSDSSPLVAGAAHILCFGGVAGNIAQSNVHTLDVVTGEWDVPHLSGVIPRPRVEPGGIVYVGDDQHIVVIQGGWNGKNYIDDLDFLHLEEPIAPDPLIRAINNPALSDFTIWAHPDSVHDANDTTSANHTTNQQAVASNDSIHAVGQIKSSSAPLLSSIASPAAARSSTSKIVSTVSATVPSPDHSDKSLDKPANDENIEKSELPAEKPVARKSLLVNRIILYARSSFFKTLFDLEPNRKEFTLDLKTDFRLFSAFIKYLYTDDIEPDLIDDTNAHAFVDLFSRYAPKHRERVLEELVITRPAIKSLMATDLSTALFNPLFSDVRFLVNDPSSTEPDHVQTIHAHRALLCTRNDVFAAMLIKPNEEHQGIVNVKGVHLEAFLETLRYIYTFQLSPETVSGENDNDNLLLDILQAAHRYGIKNLQNLCIELISANFKVDNVFPMLVVADQLAVKKLLKAAASFIRSNLTAISLLDDYQTHSALIQRTLDTYFPQQE
jgi:ankyrin repeat protein